MLSERAPYLLVGVLYALCAAQEFFPFGILGLTQIGAQFGQYLSFLLSPLIILLVVGLFLKTDYCGSVDLFKGQRKFLIVSLLTGLAIVGSALANDVPDNRVPVAATNFLLSSVFLLMVANQPDQSNSLIGPTRWLLLGWIALPILTAQIEILQPYFLTCHPFMAFHGFTNGRLLFGFWAGYSVFLFFGLFEEDKGSPVAYAAFIICWSALFISQTRAAIIPASLLLAWLFMNKRRNAVKLALIVICAALVGLAMLAKFNDACAPNKLGTGTGTTTITAQIPTTTIAAQIRTTELRTMEFRDPTRFEIYRRFTPTSAHEWLWGEGRMKLVDIERVGGGIQAHNIFLQTLGNFGIFSVLLLLFWCFYFLKLIRTDIARLLFIYFICYSLFQPLFGGSLNLFAPRPLLALLLILLLDRTQFNRTLRIS